MGLRIVAALGNPGRRYRNTRHNVGFLVASELLRRWRCGEDRLERDAVVSPIRIEDQAVLVVQPQTYMNLSGVPVGAMVRYRRIETTEVLVVYDDADLPLGRMRIRSDGGSGGHNGVASLMEHLGTREFLRIRLGIGKDEGELSDRVLSPFAPEETPAVNSMVESAADAVAVVATEGVLAAMNRFNRRNEPAG